MIILKNTPSPPSPAPSPSPVPPPTLAAIRRRYFGPLLAGLLLLRLVTLFIWLGGLIPDYPDVTFPEGALVARALDVARGHTPYQDWRQWPHAFAPYPPLAYYPAGWLARAAFGSPSAHEVYLAGRAFCFVMVVGIAVLIYLFARRLGLGPIWSLLAVAALGECQVLMEYCTSFRPDAPKTFFSLLALWILVRFRPSWRALAGALAALYLSLWFKPTAWAVSLIVGWWTWRHFGLRRATAMGVGFIAAGLIPLFLLNHLWHGALLLNIVDSLRNGATLAEVRNFFAPGDLRFQFVLLAGVVGACVAWRRPDQAHNRLLLAAVPAAFLTGLLQMLKVGADVNYQLEAFALAAVVTTWWIARLWQNECGRRKAEGGMKTGSADVSSAMTPSIANSSFLIPHSTFVEAALWLLLIPILLFGAWRNFSTLRDDLARMTHAWGPPPILRQVAGSPGPILATNPYVVLAAPTPAVLDFYQYSVLQRRGLLSAEPLLERLRRREFPIIVLLSEFVAEASRGNPNQHFLLFCEEFFPTLARNYKIVRRSEPFTIFKPLAPGESPVAGFLQSSGVPPSGGF